MKNKLILTTALSILVSTVSSSYPKPDQQPLVSGNDLLDLQLPMAGGGVTSQPDEEQAPELHVDSSVGDASKAPEIHSNFPGGEAEELGRWSYEPVCTDYFDVLKGPLCVFTNSSFSNGRGISIFTTPTIAAEFAALLPFQDPTALSSRGINPPSETDRPWQTKSIPGKGIGMLAKHQLQRGDLVAAYTPYLLAHMENLLSTTDRERYLRIAIEQLPEPSKAHYLSLATIYGDLNVVMQDVVKANAFEMQVGGQMHLAVFPESSRINHACAPNSQYHLDPTMLTHYVYAARAISPNEEITIAYAPPLSLFAERQDYLLSTFHFQCSCSRCQHGLAGDKAVSDILALQWALGNWDVNSTASVRKAEMLVRLYKEEGLEAFIDTAYGHAAFTYNAVGSPRGAKKYAKLAAEAAVLKYGHAAPGLETWNELMHDPERHSSWRRRKDG
ncbi:hypothetical protein A1O1_02516 [Capronia coronata CBS 617.96]|uniref:SET domain-containing protein n=1 Tax=Capronia coronata CBS 617.96 TaxID=1182541 RepID=W9YNJ1_9EURO|nr:uncharacterized protein A1O1_02516 [Capronia coronata CBS 617.96]EXJ94123.1 hypothetical protein A1O1_02516 [Capronia coronata CBS 617.96]